MPVKFGIDEKGEFHEGYPIFRVQKNGNMLVLCPFGHIIASDVPPELAHYYRKPIRCHGTIISIHERTIYAVPLDRE